MRRVPLSADELAQMVVFSNKDLSGINTREAEFNGKKFGDCLFKENDLEDAVFTGNTELSRCVFEKCSLSHAVFNCKRVSGVVFQGCTVDDVFFAPGVLSGASFPGSYVTSTGLQGVVLKEADLSGAQLTGVSLEGADLTKAKLSEAVLTCVDLTGARLQGADFKGTTFEKTALPPGADLTGASFAEVDARGLDFAGRNLANANFAGATLRDVSFHGANLNGALFTEETLIDQTDFTGATFEKARFEGAVLSNQDLAGLCFKEAVFSGQADLAGARLCGARFTGVRFEGTVFTSADLAACKFVDCTLNGCRFDSCNLRSCELTDCTFKGASTSFGGAATDGATIVIDTKFLDSNGDAGSVPEELAAAVRRGNAAWAGKRFEDPATFTMKKFAGKDFTDTVFKGLTLAGTDFTGSILTRTRFVGCDLRGAVFCKGGEPSNDSAPGPAAGADVVSAHFWETVFSKCNLAGAVFARLGKASGSITFEQCSNAGEADFRGADLTGATFCQKTCFTGAQMLTGATFSGSALNDTKFTNATLDRVSFAGCDLTSTEFCGATLRDVCFDKARFPGPAMFSGIRVAGPLSFAQATVPSMCLNGLPLRGFCFAGAVLDGVDIKNCEFVGADFTGVVFAGVSFAGSTLHFESNNSNSSNGGYLADFSVRPSSGGRVCDFSQCRITGVDFSGQPLTGCKFVGAALERVRFDNCNLVGTDFTDAIFASDGSVTMVGAQLCDTQQQKQHQQGISFRRCRLGGLCLSDLRLDRSVVFAEATLDVPGNFRGWTCTSGSGLDLSGAHLVGTDLSGMSLVGYSFRGATLKDVSFAGSDLTDADFAGAVFRGHTNLAGARIGPGISKAAGFAGAVLAGASFAGLTLCGARFSGCKFLTGTSFARARLVCCAFDGCDLSPTDTTGAVFILCSFAACHPAMLPPNVVSEQEVGARLVRQCLRSKRLYDGRCLNLAMDPCTTAAAQRPPRQHRHLPDAVWDGLPCVAALDLSGNDFEFLAVPDTRGERALPPLRSLVLRDNSNFVANAENLVLLGRCATALHTLDLSGTAAARGLGVLSALTALRTLNLAHNNLTELPQNLPKSLTALNISDNALTEVDLSALTALRTLNLALNSLTELPQNPPKSLTALDVSENDSLHVADRAFQPYTALADLAVRGLTFRCHALTLPATLTALDASGARSQSRSRPLTIGFDKTHSLATLRMRGAHIAVRAFESLAPTLTALDASAGSRLPPSLAAFTHLRTLALAGPSPAPEGVWGLPALCSLTLTGMGLTEVTGASLASAHTLQELNLEHNNLQVLPQSVLKMPSLRVLRIGGNPCAEHYRDVKCSNPRLVVITHEV